MRVKYDIAQNVNSIAICCGFFKKLRKKSRVFRFFIMLSMSCFVALLTVASCSRCSKSKELLDDNNKTGSSDISRDAAIMQCI